MRSSARAAPRDVRVSPTAGAGAIASIAGRAGRRARPGRGGAGARAPLDRRGCRRPVIALFGGAAGGLAALTAGASRRGAPLGRGRAHLRGPGSRVRPGPLPAPDGAGGGACSDSRDALVGILGASAGAEAGTGSRRAGAGGAAGAPASRGAVVVVAGTRSTGRDGHASQAAVPAPMAMTAATRPIRTEPTQRGQAPQARLRRCGDGRRAAGHAEILQGGVDRGREAVRRKTSCSRPCLSARMPSGSNRLWKLASR